MSPDDMTDGQFRYWKRKVREVQPRLPYLRMVALQHQQKTLTEIAQIMGMPRETIVYELYTNTIMER
jgi:hypothetical protein